METKLLVLKPAKIFGDPDELANFRFTNGRGFPASYQRFATQYGWGRSLGNYLVYIPASPHECDSWQQARAAVKSTYIDDLDEYEGFFLRTARLPDGQDGMFCQKRNRHVSVLGY